MNLPVAEVGREEGVQPPLRQRGVGGHHKVTLPGQGDKGRQDRGRWRQGVVC